MKLINRSLAIAIGILLTLVGTAIQANAETSITTCGFVITSPGNYAINADLNCPSSDGIDINSSSVSLKLNGHKITGGGSDTTTFSGIVILPVSGRVNHVGIEGPGLIQKFRTGVSITNADYSQMVLVTVARNFWGLVSQSLNYLTLGSNQFVANTNYAVTLASSSNGAFHYNDLSGNGGGFLLANGVSNTVNNNVANANPFGGISIMSDNFARVYSNVTNGSGISINSTGSSLTNNTSVGGLFFDLADSTCTSNVWSNNVFFFSEGPCIH